MRWPVTGSCAAGYRLATSWWRGDAVVSRGKTRLRPWRARAILPRMTSHASARLDSIHAGYAARIAFVVELARHLHAYGTTAQRLEGAIEAVAQKLGLECEPWVNPTGMILSFSDPARLAGESDTTRVIRLGLGETDLYKLCEADRIAEDVMAGRLDIAQGRAELHGLGQGLGLRGRVMQVAGFGLASGAVAGLLRLPWLDIATAGLIGLLIGLLEQASSRRPRLQEAGDAIAGMVAGFVAIAVASLVAPL